MDRPSPANSVSPHNSGLTHRLDRSPSVTQTEVRAAEGRLVRSPMFRADENLAEFLTFVITAAWNGNLPRVEDACGDRQEQVQRVMWHEATILRDRLEAYYRFEGQEDPLVIEIPQGEYVPLFLRRSVAEVDSLETGQRQLVPWRPCAKRLSLDIWAALLSAVRRISFILSRARQAIRSWRQLQLRVRKTSQRITR